MNIRIFEWYIPCAWCAVEKTFSDRDAMNHQIPSFIYCEACGKTSDALSNFLEGNRMRVNTQKSKFGLLTDDY